MLDDRLKYRATKFIIYSVNISELTSEKWFN